MLIGTGTAVVLQDLPQIYDRLGPDSVVLKFLPQIYRRQQLPTILVWEIIGTVRILGEDSLADYDLPQLGDLYAALRRHNWRWQGSLNSGADPPLDEMKLDQNADAIRHDWWRIVTEHPLAYLRAKLHIWSGLAGFEGDSTAREMFYNPSANIYLSPAVQAALMPGRSLLRRLGGALVAWKQASGGHPATDPLYRQWVSLVLAAGAGWILMRRRHNGPAVVVFAAACLNYAMFFVLTLSTVFRYFYPSFVCFQAIVVAALLAGLAVLLERLRRGLRRAAPPDRLQSAGPVS